MSKHHQSSLLRDSSIALVISTLLVCTFFIAFYFAFEHRYDGKIYPNVFIENVSFGGKTPNEIKQYYLEKNTPFEQAVFTFSFENHIATISGTELSIGYDATLSATQAYTIGRTNQQLSNLQQKFIQTNINLHPYFHWDDDALNQLLQELSSQINIPVQEALFQFSGGRVTTFKPSSTGREVNISTIKEAFKNSLPSIRAGKDNKISIPLAVDTVNPTFTTDRVNSFGIRELIGTGYSEFAGSIQGRIHNVILAASKINGVLIKPGETFSFNDAIGDISATTGFAQAYVIQNGKTVLGDGGGVCQVSTTLFRAAMNAGLPIVERHAHAYKVHYYEEGGFKPGIDATVFAPTVDFRFKNNTPGYILLQTKPDIQNLSLTIQLYGTSDGRTSTISNHRLWDFTPAPPDVYQDDPTLSKGVTKQVDFAASGLKAAFDYKVTRGTQILEDTTFTSTFRPWQAVYLRGTM